MNPINKNTIQQEENFKVKKITEKNSNSISEIIGEYKKTLIAILMLGTVSVGIYERDKLQNMYDLEINKDTKTSSEIIPNLLEGQEKKDELIILKPEHSKIIIIDSIRKKSDKKIIGELQSGLKGLKFFNENIKCTGNYGPETEKGVKKLQELLQKWGFLNENIKCNGHYGPKTTQAIKKLQEVNSIHGTGRLTLETVELIRKKQLGLDISSKPTKLGAEKDKNKSNKIQSKGNETTNKVLLGGGILSLLTAIGVGLKKGRKNKIENSTKNFEKEEKQRNSKRKILWPYGVDEVSYQKVNNCFFIGTFNAIKSNKFLMNELLDCIRIIGDGKYEISFKGYKNLIQISEQELKNRNLMHSNNLGDKLIELAYNKILDNKKANSSIRVMKYIFGDDIDVERIGVVNGKIISNKFDGENFENTELGDSQERSKYFKKILEENENKNSIITVSTLRNNTIEGEVRDDIIYKRGHKYIKIGNNGTMPFYHVLSVKEINTAKGHVIFVDPNDSSSIIKLGIDDLGKYFSSITVGKPNSQEKGNKKKKTYQEKIKTPELSKEKKELLEKIKNRESIKGLLPKLIWTHRTSYSALKSILEEGCIGTNNDRGVNFALGKLSGYGDIQLLMKDEVINLNPSPFFTREIKPRFFDIDGTKNCCYYFGRHAAGYGHTIPGFTGEFGDFREYNIKQGNNPNINIPYLLAGDKDIPNTKYEYNVGIDKIDAVMIPSHIREKKDFKKVSKLLKKKGIKTVYINTPKSILDYAGNSIFNAENLGETGRDIREELNKRYPNLSFEEACLKYTNKEGTFDYNRNVYNEQMIKKGLSRGKYVGGNNIGGQFYNYVGVESDILEEQAYFEYIVKNS